MAQSPRDATSRNLAATQCNCGIEDLTKTAGTVEEKVSDSFVARPR